MMLWVPFLTIASAFFGDIFCYKTSWGPVYGPPDPPHPPYGGHHHGYDYHDHHQYQPQQVIPRDVMIDVINDLGIKLLAIHNENNDNNIAISPYGALSMLVVLGEGLQGPAVHEIQDAIHLPSDPSVIRVGLRDIHRHLKSYFIPREGFLAGLTLNHDNVTLNPNYEEILKFYGFDIESFNNALYPGPMTTEKPEGSTMEITTVEGTTIESTTMESTTVEGTTIKDEETTTVAMNITTTKEMETTTVPPTTDALKSAKEQTTDMPTTTVITTVSTTMPITTKEMETTTEKLETTTTKVDTTRSISTTEEITTITDSTTVMETTSISENQELNVDFRTTTGDVLSTITDQSTNSDIPSTTTVTDTPDLNFFTTQEPFIQEILPTTVPPNYEYPFYGEQTVTPTDFYPEVDSRENLLVQPTLNGTNAKRSARSVVDYLIAKYYDNGYEYYEHPKGPSYIPDEPLTFLTHGKYREGGVSFMVYNTVLPFLFVPHLNALALSFPLDNDKYYLLLLLPLNPQGIDDLICDLRLNSSLKYIIKNLKLTHVKATIPSFMLKGYVVLTPTLQKLGIRKVFEPRHADFSPMTTEKEIYVTNIEQAVTVTIRNYVNFGNLPNYRNLYQQEPIHFKADHPFLYFVIDADLHVALMAGKIVNPLNSRVR